MNCLYVYDKCDLYSVFKTTFQTEYYLTCLNVRKFRIGLARFRCSSHDLNIEKGRYANIDRNCRICPLCNLNAVEDEFHFVMICPFYAALRQKYINQKYYVHPNLRTFSALLNSENQIEIKRLSMYIFYASTYRGSVIWYVNSS